MRVALAGDGPEQVALAALIDKLGLGDAVEQLGGVPMGEVAAVLWRATVVVVPSRNEEPFGLVAVEAGLAGGPVVASRVGGLPEVVEDGRNGLLVPPDDPDVLAGAVLTVLRDPALAARLGGEGRARAEHDFGIDRHVDAYEELFVNLLAR